MQIARPALFLTIILSATLLPIRQADAFEPTSRVFGSATAAVVGGMVAGPVGLAVGAIIGYALGPAITGDTLVRKRRVARRAVRRVPVAAAEPQYAPGQQAQSYGQPPAYGQPGYPQQQPMYLGQQVPSPGQTQPYITAPAQQVQPQTQGQPNYAASAVIANRPPIYAAVPLPMQLAPSGNYAPYAYKPQGDGQSAEPSR